MSNIKISMPLIEETYWAEVIQDIKKSNALDDLYCLLQALVVVKTKYAAKRCKYEFIL